LLQEKNIETTPLVLYNFFIEKIKENLHLTLAMSPIGDAFRNRLRMFLYSLTVVQLTGMV